MPEYAEVLQNRKKHLEHIRVLEAEHEKKIEMVERVIEGLFRNLPTKWWRRNKHLWNRWKKKINT